MTLSRVPLSEIIGRLEAGVSVLADGRPAQSGELGVLKVSAVTGGVLKPEENKWVSKASEIARLAVSPVKGDIIMTRANGSKELVGCSVYVHADHPALFLSDKLWRVSVKDDTRDLPEWLFQVLNLDSVRREVIDTASGSSGMRNISKQAFLNITVARPAFAHQQRIAAILSTWDRAIELTEKLIEAKQRRKAALMQRLLTGKARLPGFVGQWSSAILGDLGTTYSGLQGVSKDDFGSGRPYIDYLNVFHNSRICLHNMPLVNVQGKGRQTPVRYGDLFFTISSETPEDIGMASVLLDPTDEVYLNSFCFGFRLHSFDALLPEFARYLLRGIEFRKMMLSLAQGATRYNLSKRQLVKTSLHLPPIAEQQAIAAVLATADDEIALHRRKLDALRRQKAGLMQQLLTGKVRVNVPDGSPGG